MTDTGDLRLEYEAAVRPQIRRLYALAYSILRDKGEAEDAVQETLLNAWKGWSKARNPVHPDAWLAKICTNNCLRRHRRLAWHRRADDQAVVVSPDQISGLPFEGRLLDLDRAFRRLSVRQRTAIALHYHHGYQVSECAHLMGCRPGTARSHLGRALTTLRKELSDV